MILNCDICGKEVTYDWTIMTYENFEDFLKEMGMTMLIFANSLDFIRIVSYGSAMSVRINLKGVM